MTITSLAGVRVMESTEAAAAPSLLRSEVSIKPHHHGHRRPHSCCQEKLGPAVAPALATGLGRGC